MSTQNQVCCVCEQQFYLTNQPRIMQSCDHNICTKCLEISFSLDKKEIMCIFCQIIDEIQGDDLDSFPKNVKIIKTMKQQKKIKEQLLQNIVFDNKQNNQILQQRQILLNSIIQIKQNTDFTKQKKFICQTHNKEMQLICLKDYTRLCPMCALFGIHKQKQHKIKTISQIQQIINFTDKQFNQTKSKKKNIESLIKNSGFKSKIVEKLNGIQIKYTNQISQKFNYLRQIIDSAEENAYDDLNKRIKEIYGKINNLVKEKSQFEPLFNNWVMNVNFVVEESSKAHVQLQNKIKSYYEGPITLMKQGVHYLTQIQDYMNKKLINIQRIPDEITLEFNDSIIKDIFNYLSIKIQDKSYCQYFDNENSLKVSQKTLADSNYNNSIGFKSFSSQNTLNFDNFIHNTASKKPIKVEFGSCNDILSTHHKNRPKNLNYNQKKSSLEQKNNESQGSLLIQSTFLIQSEKEFINKSCISSLRQNQQSENKPVLQQKICEAIETFCNDQHIDSLDLSSFQLNDAQIIKALSNASSRKRIKCLKLAKNKLTNQGFTHILPFIQYVTNLNITRNLLTEQVMSFLMKNRQKIPNLRILTLAQNKVNQRKAKNFIDQLKKQGIIITV